MILLIDHYDSFTYNLFQYYKQLHPDVLVVQQDEITVEQVEKWNPDLIVLSPGPGNPKNCPASQAIVKAFYQQIPILGICLGLQIIVEVFGGTVTKGIQPMHGKRSLITHDQKGIFKEVTDSIYVTRYHSLIASLQDFPADLILNSMSADGVIMGVRHSKFPLEAIQFHPESEWTEYGFQMVRNSYEQALAWHKNREGLAYESASII
ncbi:aminodeoxychorismate/anthranilate synthase component II [Radiobacillus kanasensis]|uniref:anthranilate synthase component II n=1 Tax=Radiobacillus kanasensis TaxID=2844358 RepID=UPI001E5E417D|nr:aminodeoxychorismate/anthranilate synthase component II [Radiobacillus kanasensis]UFU00709.1 aminodeoxychorismate/anthranilate synthase component II [Radiobacillus kanasensis]